MKPYPEFPPNYKEVPKVGGMTRTCFVIEFRSDGDLSNTQLAMIEEQVAATVAKIASKIPIVEKVEFVPPGRFDPMLLEGLRLQRQ